MNEAVENKILQLAKILDYPKNDLYLLKIAITHRSVGDPNNERLEFLGDSVLNFIIGAELFYRLPEADEGTLTRFRAKLVKRETLIELATTLKLGDYLLLGPGEKKTGGHQRGSILADALEAIIGCMYCTVGIDKIKQLILKWYKCALEEIIDKNIDKDPKTKLQELLQSKKMQLPKYNILNITGPSHDQVFYVVCETVLLQDPVEGTGISRRKAEQDAAEKALQQISSDLL
jgi:ribonuclease III